MIIKQFGQNVVFVFISYTREDKILIDYGMESNYQIKNHISISFSFEDFKKYNFVFSYSIEDSG